MPEHADQTRSILAQLDLSDTGTPARALHRRLFEALRQAILSGQLAAGSRLPATRTLARELGISRNTIIQAFEQLGMEGFIESRVGSGTRVCWLPPERLARPTATAGQDTASEPPRLSARGRLLAAGRRGSTGPAGRAFVHGVPALDRFPHAVWARLLARRARAPGLAALGYDNHGGLEALRNAIAHYLAIARGVSCNADQIVVVAGAQSALDLTARMLVDPGDAVWLEDPGYGGARGALSAAGAQLVPVPVDEDGIDVEHGIRHANGARLVYVTPSSQFPTATTMSLERRLALLDWADRNDAWVIEDDYDSEYRYRGRPLTALQGLDTTGRVVYVGTFSKTLFPGLRLGYLVLPASLQSAFRRALEHTGQDGSLVLQATLVDFMEQGHLAAHIRRMRALYAARQGLLVRSLKARSCPTLRVSPCDAGLQLVAELHGVDDRLLATRLARHGVWAMPLSPLCHGSQRRNGLILGFAGVDEASIESGARVLVRETLRSLAGGGHADDASD